MNSFKMLVRREFWEHRSLYIAPLVWAAIVVILSTWVLFVVVPNDVAHGMHDGANIDQHIEGLSEADRAEIKQAIATAKEHEAPQAALSLSFLGLAQLISVFTCVVVFFYLIDCLFTERRDRSILFWKSLPLSDTQVVLSKLVVALVIVPIGVVLLAAVVQLLLYALVMLRFDSSMISGLMSEFTIGAWFRALLVEGAVMFCGILWYAPIAAYFMLLSAWARKLVFLWAIVPLIAIPALEGFFFHTMHFLEFLGQRFGGFVMKMRLDTSALNVGSSDTPGPRMADVLSSIDISKVLLSSEMWIGLAAAAAMIFLTIRIRRYRDET